MGKGLKMKPSSLFCSIKLSSYRNYQWVHFFTIAILIIVPTLCFMPTTKAMEMDENEADLPTVMNEHYKICGKKYNHECHSYNCLRKYFLISLRKYENVRAMKSFSDSKPAYLDKYYTSTFKTIDFIKCDKKNIDVTFPYANDVSCDGCWWDRYRWNMKDPCQIFGFRNLRTCS